MSDATVYSDLAQWASDAAEHLQMRASLCRDRDQHDAAEVADAAGAQFGALASLMRGRLVAQRVRLTLAVGKAEAIYARLDEQYERAIAATRSVTARDGEQSSTLRYANQRLNDTERARDAADAERTQAKAALAAFEALAGEVRQ
ncbi:MAG: hypothetical protein ACYDHY_17525 [Acidiferrobacterales bacterium]